MGHHTGPALCLPGSPMGGSLKHHLAILSALALAGFFCMPLYAQEDRAPAPGSAPSAEAPSTEAPAIDESSLRLDDQTAADSLVKDREGGSSAWALVRAILVLAVLAFLVWLLLFFIRRRAAQQAGASPHLRVLASTSVALNRHVHVVSLGSKAWLVGSSESGVNLIAELVDQELVDQLRLEDSRRTALESTVAGNFSKLFSTFTGKGRGRGIPESAGTPFNGDARESASGNSNRSDVSGVEDGAQGVESLRRARERLNGL